MPALIVSDIDHFELSDLNTEYREVGDFEFDSDRCALISVSLLTLGRNREEKGGRLTTFNTWKTEMSSHQELLALSQLLGLPNERRFARSVLVAA